MKKIVKSDKEWRDQLSPLEYEITRQGGTEPPHCSLYLHHTDPGTYLCVCCEEPLFSSSTKFDSGSGWPEFMQPVSDDAIKYLDDYSMPVKRTEVKCNVCNAHLGHVFDDGPPHTHKRY